LSTLSQHIQKTRISLDLALRHNAHLFRICYDLHLSFLIMRARRRLSATSAARAMRACSSLFAASDIRAMSTAMRCGGFLRWGLQAGTELRQDRTETSDKQKKVCYPHARLRFNLPLKARG